MKNFTIGVLLAPLVLAKPVYAQNDTEVIMSANASPLLVRRSQGLDFGLPGKEFLSFTCEQVSLASKTNYQWGDSTQANGESDRHQLPDATNFNLAQATLAEPTEEILRQALDVANTLQDPQSKATVLSEIAQKYLSIGQQEKASEVLSQALEVADSITETPGKARTLAEIALAYNALDEVDLALNVLSQAQEVANNIEDGQVKASLLTAIALKYAELGEYEQSTQLISESQQVVKTALAPPILFPFQPTDWQGSLTLSNDLFSGSETTSVVSINAELERQWPTDEFDVSLNLSNDFDDSRAENLNQFQGQLQGEYRHHFSERWQYFVSSLVRRDEPDNIDIRTNLYTGPGINLWRAAPDKTLDMQLGLGIRFEESNRRTSDLDFPVAQYRLRYKDILFGNVNLRQFFTLELPLGDIEDYYISSSTELSIPITQEWSFSNTLILRYSGVPTLGNPNLRIDLETGIKYDF